MAIYYGDGSNSSNGRIVKFHKGTFTTKTSSTSQNYDIFNVDITPQAAGNWFHITGRVAASHAPSQSFFTQFLIDNQYVGGRTADLGASISRSLFFDSVSNNHRSNAAYNTYEGAYTHIQSSASAFNFKMRTRLQGGTQYLNYAYSYDDNDRGKPICYYHIIEMEPS